MSFCRKKISIYYCNARNCNIFKIDINNLQTSHMTYTRKKLFKIDIKDLWTFHDLHADT